MIAHRPRSSLRGFTLIEILISLALFLIMSGSIFGILGMSQIAFIEETVSAEMQTTARRVLNRINEDLRSGILTTLTPSLPVTSRSISVAPAAGYVGGVVTEGPRLGFELRPDPSDPANGKDDDGDGHIDESRVVRTAGGVEMVIAGNVQDLSFTLFGGTVLASIRLEKTIRGRRTFTFADSVEVRVRN